MSGGPLTFVSKNGIRYHLIPEGEPALWPSEIIALAGSNNPDEAELILVAKQVFGNAARFTASTDSAAVTALRHQITTFTGDDQMALFNFGKEEVQDQSFDLLPAGRYVGSICNHELKPTKSGGHMLNLTIEIIGPTHEGRKLFDGLNIDNANDVAVKIAMASFKSICIHAGVPEYFDAFMEAGQAAEGIEDLEPILGELPMALYTREIGLNVAVQPAKDGYPEQNKIKAYGPPKAGSATAATPPKAATAAKKPSWASK